VQADFVDPITVPVPNDRFVTGVSEEEGIVCRTETAVVFAEFVDDVEPGLRGAVDAQRVAAVSIEVSSKRDI